jgi:hypothetical protein
MVRTIRRGYFGAVTVLAAMVLLCVLAGSSAASPGDTIRVSVDSSGTQANSDNFLTVGSSTSDNGRYVAFASDATNLVAGDTNGRNDIFVRDLQGGPPSA